MIDHENYESSEGDSIGDWWGEGGSDEIRIDNYDKDIEDEIVEQFKWRL
jgi:hypothetical protein